MNPGEEALLGPNDWVVEAGTVHSAHAAGGKAAVVVFSGWRRPDNQ